MSNLPELLAEVDAIEHDPIMRPMGPVSSIMTTLGGLCIGYTVRFLIEHRALPAGLCAAAAPVLLVPFAIRFRRRRKVLRRISQAQAQVRQMMREAADD